MQVFVVGASGLLGRGLVGNLQRFQLAGSSYARSGPDLMVLDARDLGQVRAIVKDLRPDVIINSAGERRVEYWDRPELRERNVLIARNLARVAEEAELHLVHISSDYVFDGTMPSYRPSSRRNALNVYGRSKCDAEDVVLSENPSAVLLRVPVLYGPVRDLRESNMSALLLGLVSGQPFEVDHYFRRHPTSVRQVAHAMQVIVSNIEALRGSVLHWSSDVTLTAYEMTRLVARHMGISASMCLPCTPSEDERKGRPFDVRLECGELEKMGLEPSRDIDGELKLVVPSYRKLLGLK